MNYRPHVQEIECLATLQGDFAFPYGNVEECEGGLCFKGDGYEWRSETVSHPSGVYQRTDRIKNTSDHPIALRSALSKFCFLGGEYEVFTQYNEWCGEGYGKWVPLLNEVGAEGNSVRTNSSASPFVALYSNQTNRGMVFQLLQTGLWMLRVRRNGKSTIRRVEVEMGILPRGFDYTLGVGEELELPSILYYEFRNKTDLDSYKLHRYCNAIYPARDIPIIYNTWLSRFDTVSFDILSEQLPLAKRIGAQYFVIDAGWFGEPGTWNQRVGDWNECQTASMEGRMGEFAQLVRDSGLKFGLWFEPERATRMAQAPKDHPDYYRFEKLDYFLDFGNPEARKYMYDILADRIRQYGIEFIKFDFNCEMTYDRMGEAFLPYFEGYQKFIDEIRAQFPHIYLENCASGGERLTLSDFFKGFDSFWVSDNQSIYKQIEMYKGNILHMPPRSLERWVTVQSMKNFGPVYGNNEAHSDPIIACSGPIWAHLEGVTRDYLFASLHGGPIGISCDLTRWSERLLTDMREFLKSYRADLEFWKDAECHILCDTESMLVLQHNDSAFSQIKICGFSKTPMQYGVNVYPFCEKDMVFVDGEGKEYTGEELDADGVELPIADRFTGYTLTLKRK